MTSGALGEFLSVPEFVCPGVGGRIPGGKVDPLDGGDQGKVAREGSSAASKLPLISQG